MVSNAWISDCAVFDLQTLFVSGGLVLGPIGLALGGSIGGCLAAYMGQGKFKPLALVIMEDIKDEQRVQMVNAVRAIVDNIGLCPFEKFLMFKLILIGLYRCWRCNDPCCHRVEQRGAEEQGHHRDGHLPQQAVQYLCQ